MRSIATALLVTALLVGAGPALAEDAGPTGDAGPAAPTPATSCGYEFRQSDPRQADGYRERNALVSTDEDSRAPAPPDVGLAIGLGGSGHRFRAGRQIRLFGTLQADLDFIRECEGAPLSHVELMLTRIDRGCAEREPLFVIDVALSHPPISATTRDQPSYRTTEWFSLDLVRFFGLPAEPGSYAVVARAGSRSSNRVTFEIVAP